MVTVVGLFQGVQHCIILLNIIVDFSKYFINIFQQLKNTNQFTISYGKLPGIVHFFLKKNYLRITIKS